MICPKCYKHFSNELKFCPYCGKPNMKKIWADGSMEDLCEAAIYISADDRVYDLTSEDLEEALKEYEYQQNRENEEL